MTGRDHPDPPAEPSEHSAELRQRALASERDAAPPSEERAKWSPETSDEILHELRVHQIELAMQNEELRRAYEELEASRTRYFELYDLAPVGYCTVAESGLIVQANLCAATLLGATRGTLTRQAFSRFLVKEDQDSYYLLRRHLLDSGKPQWCDLRLLKSDGTPFWAQLAASVAQADDGAPILRIVLNDISERKRVETERLALDQALKERNIELDGARLAAEKANRAKSEFLSSMSHELRTPLSAILGFSQLLETGTPPPTPNQKRSIEQILKAGWYLLELINEILDLALVESGRLSLASEPVSLAEVMQECATLVEAQAKTHAVTVRFPQFAGPCLICADRMRVKEVLLNLLSNAIKYNNRGGAVGVDCVTGLVDHASIRINVRDTGVGLAPQQLAQLFQPFNRLGQESCSEQGTGIGLVVSKRLVELMGGVIGVESRVGAGSVFWMELRRAAPSLLPVVADDAAGAVAANGPLDATPRVLLYVEDNPANLMLVEDIVARRSDLRFLSARDASSAIELARNVLPDVILMDINLPGVSGFDALQILAGDPDTAAIPVLALSANAMPDDIEKGLAAGFFRYLTKPIKIDELTGAVDVALAYARNLHANATGKV